MNARVWQAACVPPLLAEVFTRSGVLLVGQGDVGEWQPVRAGQFTGNVVARLAQEVQVGDVLLLRSGLSRLLAVGIVASAYLYLPQFDDAGGLDMQHARRVRWAVLPEPYDFSRAVFPAGSTLSLVTDPELVDYAARFINSPPDAWQQAALPSLPAEEALLETPPPLLADLVAQACDLSGLYGDGQRFGEPPSEAELVAHFILPLLRRLGWPPELIALEWHGADLALFRTLPRRAENLCLLVEAKRPGRDVGEALAQALGYMQSFGAHCDILISDGLHYRLYAAEKRHVAAGYANLTRLKPSALPVFEKLSRKRFA